MIICLVAMPLGCERDPAGGPDIDFDRVYERGVQPAIQDAGLEPVRAGAGATGGVVGEPMFERCLLSDFFVADLTLAGPAVHYQLGARNAARRSATLPIFAAERRIALDLGGMDALAYQLGADNAFGDAQAAALRASLAARLRAFRDAPRPPGADFPLLRLLQPERATDLAHDRTDGVEEQLVPGGPTRDRIREARAVLPISAAKSALQSVESSLDNLNEVVAGVTVDLYLAYRAVGAHREMLALHDRMPLILRRTVLVREQRAFALNRLAAKAGGPERDARRREAQEVLEAIVSEIGPNAETCSLLGRIHKDRWEEALVSAPDRAPAWLARAIAEYRRGFEADSRDSYPGINTATLLEVQSTPEALRERDRILPVVRFAAERRADAPRADYWDHATLIEAHVLESDFEAARAHLARALAAVREHWEPETTSRNLALIERARSARGETTTEIAALRARLDAHVEAKKGAQKAA